MGAHNPEPMPPTSNPNLLSGARYGWIPPRIGETALDAETTPGLQYDEDEADMANGIAEASANAEEATIRPLPKSVKEVLDELPTWY